MEYFELTFYEKRDGSLPVVEFLDSLPKKMRAKALREMDILKEYPKERFDIIVSNPPYICDYVIKDLQTEVKDYEPYGALSGGADGLLFYRRITEIAPGMLNENGILAYEIGCDQGEAVSELMRKSFCNVRVLKDLCGNDRVIIGEMKMRRS